MRERLCVQIGVGSGLGLLIAIGYFVLLDFFFYKYLDTLCDQMRRCCGYLCFGGMTNNYFPIPPPDSIDPETNAPVVYRTAQQNKARKKMVDNAMQQENRHDRVLQEMEMGAKPIVDIDLISTKPDEV